MDLLPPPPPNGLPVLSALMRNVHVAITDTTCALEPTHGTLTFVALVAPSHGAATHMHAPSPLPVSSRSKINLPALNLVVQKLPETEISGAPTEVAGKGSDFFFQTRGRHLPKMACAARVSCHI
jgi:hypothetical protein